MQTLSVHMEYDYRPPVSVALILFSLYSIKYCSEEDKKLFNVGMGLSFTTFVAVLLLTNWDFMATLNFLIPAVMFSFLPIIKWLEQHTVSQSKSWKYSLIILFCGLTIFHNGYLAKAMNTQKLSFYEIGGIVKSGPAMGIVSEYMGPYLFNATMQEWEQYIEDSDKVLIVSEGSCDPIHICLKMLRSVHFLP